MGNPLWVDMEEKNTRPIEALAFGYERQIPIKSDYRATPSGIYTKKQKADVVQLNFDFIQKVFLIIYR